ncbi:Peptidyl-prolyl cis-trans isomerase cyp6 [Mycoblastus sanguinarius]|nr:Peptidyl-prolyl cis-trans isomerase cyp6 [Mycoblastus sanguinarius]
MTEEDEYPTEMNPATGGDPNNEEETNEKGGPVQADEQAEEEAREKVRREREARAQALTLEIVGDLPYAEVKPPENVLFVCKLNPVTEEEDLDTIFSRFGTILSCEVIRDKRTKDSLQYAFIEYENQKDCEQAYFKMQGVLIDDHRIHVDFSQSVSRLSDKWRTATNSKRAQHGGGFGGISELEKKRQYRAMDSKTEESRRRSNGYGMVFDKEDMRDRDRVPDQQRATRNNSRSRSPKGHDRYRERTPPIHEQWRRERSRGYRRDSYEDRSRRR